jgi:hypothetical protein
MHFFFQHMKVEVWKRSYLRPFAQAWKSLFPESPLGLANHTQSLKGSSQEVLKVFLRASQQAIFIAPSSEIR